MRRAISFLVTLVVGLGVLTLVGYAILTRTTEQWFETDLTLRARLAVESARSSLARNWTSDRGRLRETLEDISRDERIMAAAACAPNGETLAATASFPPDFKCQSLMARAESTTGPNAIWATTAEIPSGRVHLSVMRIESDGADLGAVVLVHDLSYVGRREATARNMVLLAFFVLSVAASLVTLLAMRLAWRGWVLELRRALKGDAGESATEAFQPLMRDVRTLADRLARERDVEAGAGAWSPKRLRSTLRQYLQGERVVLLANREPYIHDKTDEGMRVLHPASGLVTALEPVMRACYGVWVAHGAGSGDRETVDAHDRVKVPPGEESYVLRRVWLSEEEENGYYYGFSNEGLWPLCHVAHTRPLFRASDWEHYVRVNKRFADAVCEEVDSDDPIVLVQDYHFALAPKMIRERLPKATIITFWHIPWPNAERIGICPWREELISGMLGSSILGFHTQQHCNNFIDSVDAFMESRIDRETQSVTQGSRKTLVRAYPISIEWPVHWLDKIPSVAECRKAIRRQHGLADDALIGVGIDRLDYTKGVEERLSAVNELLVRHPEFRGKFTFIQLAAPSRTKIAHYRDLNDRVDALANEINERWSQGSYRPIVLLRQHHEPPSVFEHYRAAELCYVSSLHDGMNLVAKEFVAARDDEQGVLVLSQFTGAARDLSEALVVNPYDLRQASEAMAAALHMAPSEQRERMQSLRRLVSEFNVYRWAGRMLVDAAELRRRERMTGRLSSTPPVRHLEAV
jgi:trehalose 6-phosphate synthase